MSQVAVATAPRPKPRRRRPPTSQPPANWWGPGAAPLEQWPGVTIEIPAVWHAERARWESPDGRFYFDAAAADRACAFFPTLLRHHIGEFAGQPFELLEYQAKLLTRPIFGWKRAADGLRRFRKVFAFLPKGGGKSPWGAGTGLYLTIADNESAAEVYAVAGDKDQARVVHENAKIMVEASEDLSEVLEVLRDSIYHPDSLSTYQVLSSDAKTKHGFRPHGVVFDELHNQKNRDLFEALRKSMVKRRQPLLIIITHAGDDDEGICYEEYEYAKAVLSGTIPDASCLPVLFEASPTDDWTSPAVWARVNPGHGVTVKHEGIAAECEEAKAEPRKLNDFLRYHLNRWVNQATAWIPVDWWDACNEPLPPASELATYPCAVGIDMAQKIDLAALVIAFRLPLVDAEPTTVDVVTEDAGGAVLTRQISLDYRIAVLPTFWLPAETLRERVQQDHVPYDLWAKQGLLQVVDGAIVGAEAIVAHVLGTPAKPGGLLAPFPLLKQAQFGYDPAFATDVALGLRDRGGLTVVEVPQNFKHMSEPCHVFEALVKAKRVIHGGHRLLRWNLENVAVKKDDAGRLRPVKPRKQTKRIDGIVAILDAINRLIVTPATPKRSVYASRGAMIVSGGDA